MNARPVRKPTASRRPCRIAGGVMLLLLTTGCTTGASPERVAEIRTLEAESAARLAAEGETANIQSCPGPAAGPSAAIETGAQVDGAPGGANVQAECRFSRCW